MQIWWSGANGIHVQAHARTHTGVHIHVYSTCSGNASITDHQNQLFWVKISRSPTRGNLDPKDTWLLAWRWENFGKSCLKALALPTWDFTICPVLGPELLLEYNVPELDRIPWLSIPRRSSRAVPSLCLTDRNSHFDMKGRGIWPHSI